MSNTKFEFGLTVYINLRGQEKDVPKDLFDVPIQSFEVEGGANRKIEVSSPDPISVSSEFEQARTFKNITFYVLPTNDFTAVKLIGLRSPEIRFFDLVFSVRVYSGKLVTNTILMHCRSAWFVRTPTPMGGTPPLLKAQVHFHPRDVTLRHGQYDPKQKIVVEDEV